MEKITLSGSPDEIGFQHGKLLSDQIHRNIKLGFNYQVQL